MTRTRSTPVRSDPPSAREECDTRSLEERVYQAAVAKQAEIHATQAEMDRQRDELEEIHDDLTAEQEELKRLSRAQAA